MRATIARADVRNNVIEMEPDVTGALQFTGVVSEHGNERYHCRLCDKHLDAWPSNPSRWRHWHARTHGIVTREDMDKFYSKRPTRVKSQQVLAVERTVPPTPTPTSLPANTDALPLLCLDRVLRLRVCRRHIYLCRVTQTLVRLSWNWTNDQLLLCH